MAKERSEDDENNERRAREKLLARRNAARAAARSAATQKVTTQSGQRPLLDHHHPGGGSKKQPSEGGHTREKPASPDGFKQRQQQQQQQQPEVPGSDSSRKGAAAAAAATTTTTPLSNKQRRKRRARARERKRDNRMIKNRGGGYAMPPGGRYGPPPQNRDEFGRVGGGPPPRREDYEFDYDYDHQNGGGGHQGYYNNNSNNGHYSRGPPPRRGPPPPHYREGIPPGRWERDRGIGNLPNALPPHPRGGSLRMGGGRGRSRSPPGRHRPAGGYRNRRYGDDRLQHYRSHRGRSHDNNSESSRSYSSRSRSRSQSLSSRGGGGSSSSFSSSDGESRSSAGSSYRSDDDSRSHSRSRSRSHSRSRSLSPRSRGERENPFETENDKDKTDAETTSQTKQQEKENGGKASHGGDNSAKTKEDSAKNEDGGVVKPFSPPKGFPSSQSSKQRASKRSRSRSTSQESRGRSRRRGRDRDRKQINKRKNNRSSDSRSSRSVSRSPSPTSSMSLSPSTASSSYSDASSRHSRERRRERKSKRPRRRQHRESASRGEKRQEDGFSKDQRTVFVSQLVMRTTERDLKKYFKKKVGCKVNDVILLRDRRNARNHKGCAYVEVGRIEDVATAVAVSGQPPDFQRFPILVKASEAEKNYQNTGAANGTGDPMTKTEVVAGPESSLASNTNAYGNVGSSDQGNLAGQSSLPTAATTGDNTYFPPLRDENGRLIESQKVYVGGLDPSVREEHLYSLFSQFGTLRKVQLQYHPNSHISRGYAFLTFRDPKISHLAIRTMAGKILGGRPLKMGWANQNVQSPSSIASGSTIVTSDHFPDDASELTRKALAVLVRMTGGAAVVPPELQPTIVATNLAGSAVSTMAEQELDKAMGLLPDASATVAASSIPTIPTVAQARASMALGGAGSRSAMGSTVAEARASLAADMAARQLAAATSAAAVAAATATAKSSFIGNAGSGPTRHLLVHNMYDKDEETDPGWEVEIKEEFLDECSKFGTIEHAKVMHLEPGGKIHATFADTEGAKNCAENLAGRWFDKRQLRVDYMTEANPP